jgi:hypothetical protein
MLSRRASFLIILVALALPSCTSVIVRPGGVPVPVVGTKPSAPGLAALRIRVRDEYRAAVAQAAIRVSPVGMTPDDRQASSTDEFGRVTFTDLQPGRYEIVVQPPQPYNQNFVRSTVELGPSQTREMDLEVKRCTTICKRGSDLNPQSVVR